jgi:catechol 2,3-dioxygenase-like lactoylglutathione lyase family enzyme
MTILANHYVLAVHNVARSAKFYVDILGFQITANPPGWIFVSKDNCTIMLGECPDDLHPSQLGCHNYFAYLVIDNVDTYHADLTSRGAQDISPPSQKPWGMKEFTIKTPDGHRLTIGQKIPAASS